MEVIELTLSPPVFLQGIQGECPQGEGVRIQGSPPIPPLSGGEVTRTTEEKGRGLSERSEFRSPRRRLRRQTQKPDNSGGASWFVLLAAEKNEQIKRINVTRTFFDRERKSLVFNLLPLPCPVTLRGVAHKIGAEAKEKYISPSSSVFCNAKYRGGVRRTEGLIKTR